MATSRDEFKVQVEALFDQIDKDGSGFLSQDEAWQYHQDCAKAMENEPNEEEFKTGFLTLDKNADGKISKKEMMDVALADFDKMNANK